MITNQEYITNYLKKSKQKDKISHAYLFTGSEYSGKEEIAAWFVKSLLNCQDPDITEIKLLENKKEILIDQIRKLRKYLSLSPHSSDYKAAIIYNAHQMNSQAANALLKTLEEPRGNAVIILITAIPSALPDTIVSRCEEINFRAPCLNEVSEQINKHDYTNLFQKSLNHSFEEIGKISRKKSEALALLDNWLFWFRKLLIDEQQQEYNDHKLLDILKEIQTIKKLISSTNINRQLALENLILNIYV